MQRKYAIGAVLAVVVVLIAIAVFFLSPNAPTELSREFSSNGFSFRYPATWQYQIPQVNILFLASPEVSANQIGATMTVQRAIRFAPDSDTLEGNLQYYLERGPLRTAGAWEIVEAMQPIEFAGRDAMFIALEGTEIAGAAPMRSESYITQADSRFFYLFTVTAPLGQETSMATLEAILATVQILE